MPEQPGYDHSDTAVLLAKVEHQLTSLAEQTRTAKRERRRLRRARRAQRLRVRVRASMPVLRSGLMFIAIVAFATGLMLMMADTDDPMVFFALAGAACALAALTPSGK
ncbi:hypothetical protein GCM10011578_096840 [Streptomyces fuscichromogenes]|uniref:DUF3040 domain-containing protein n=2 Tax=Streptomyces fuscichromogenes TaxID=1324013 RepID=A0A917XQD9_9ACTN|nr:hypothetical protein GCM10011578_096840 [Streptomyces fuscichromogenes]